MSLLFMKLPSKRDYADYYAIIKNPISLKQIKSNLKKYKNNTAFKADFQLLFKNAKSYNQEGSAVYNDAVTLEKIFEKEFDKEFKSNSDSDGEEREDAFDLREDSMDAEGDIEVTED